MTFDLDLLNDISELRDDWPCISNVFGLSTLNDLDLYLSRRHAPRVIADAFPALSEL